MTALTSTTTVLRLVTATVAMLDVATLYTDFGGTTPVLGAQDTAITTAATTTIIAAPAAATQRLVKGVTVRNKGAVAVWATVEKFNGTVAHEIVKVSLGPGERLEYADLGWRVMDAAGTVKTKATDGALIRAVVLPIMKTGTTKEQVGVYHSNHSAAGVPAAWSPGAPGMAGRATDGMSAADVGCLPLWTTSNALFLDQMMAFASATQTEALFDIMWVNTGAVVTTITAQTVASVVWPARDMDGQLQGRGCLAGVLVTAATTNAAAIANMTISYTNHLGVAGRTGTMAAFPATAALGTVIFFNLQAGDEGMASIQIWTLGTSLLTGTASLFVGRFHAQVPVVQAFVGNAQTVRSRLYAGTCLLHFAIANATGGANSSSTATVVERA